MMLENDEELKLLEDDRLVLSGRHEYDGIEKHSLSFDKGPAREIEA